MAQFGYPVAIEKGPQAAVRAALAIVERMRAVSRDLAARFGEEVHVRIGMQTGVVVVGDMGSDTHRQSGTLVGEAANVAARLQAIARLDSVVIGGATQALLEGRFDVRPLGPQALRGLTREVFAYEVVGERYDVDLVAADRSSDFVGRAAELAELLSRWEDLKADRGAAVQIVGDAGIGKSRLVREVRSAIGDDAATVTLAGSVHHRNVALYPFIEYLRHAGREGNPVALGGDPEAVAAIEELVNPGALRSGPAHKPAMITPEIRRKVHDLLVAAVMRGSDTQPLLVVVEDAHWLDPSSMEVVERLLAAAHTRSALMLLTSRAELALASAAPDRTPAVMRLGRLDIESCRTIVQCIAGAEIPDGIVRSITARCDGTPLFAEQLTLAFVATGAIGESSESSGYADSQVPAPLHDSLLARLDRLGDAKTVAQQAAVLGRKFRRDLLAALHAKSDEELDESLAQLAAAGIVVPDQGGAPDAFEFRHALLRDAAYQSMLKGQRRLLHAQVGAAIESAFPVLKELEPDLVAQHWAQAGEPERAARHGLKAARLSAMRSSNVEAMAQAAAVLDQVKLLPAGALRDGLELEACIATIGPLIATKGYGAPDVERISVRALELAQGLGPASEEGIARAFPILYCRWSHLQVTGRVREAHALAEQMMTRSEAQSSVPPRIIGRRLLGTSLLLRGRPAQAREQLMQALALYQPAEHAGLAYIYGTDFGVMSQCHLAFACWHLGELERSTEAGKAALDDARSMEHANTLGYALTHLCLLRALERDIGGMAALAKELIELSRQRELPFWGAVALGFVGWYETCAGKAHDGLAKLMGGLQFMNRMNLVYWMPTYRTWVAEAQLAAGEPAAAEQSLADALNVVERGDERWFESECWRVRARLDIAQGRGAGVALATLARSLQAASANESKSFELRTALDACRLLDGDHALAWGEPRQAILARYVEPFRVGPHMADQREALALLVELGKVAADEQAP